MRRVIDMTGKTYALLTGQQLVGHNPKNRNAIWQFLCACGRSCQIDGYAVRSGKVTTCQVCAAERSRIASVKHGMSNSPEFSTWTDIKTRCYNERGNSWENYGGRGIRVCDRWLDSFSNFLTDMGFRPSQDHSIERRDNDGNYEPTNCHWATCDEQSNNRRTNHAIAINGLTKTGAQWAKASGLKTATVLARLKTGKSGEILIAPVRNGAVEFNGIRDTFEGWSKRTGIKPSTIAMRLRNGWPIEKALIKGVSL